MRLLLVEDDVKLGEHIVSSLKNQGFNVTLASEVLELEEVLSRQAKFDMIILDRLIGSRDTKDLLPRMKRVWPQIPLLVLSAINTPNERTELLNMGVDDYVGKPFSTQELIARVRALQRRVGSTQSSFLKLGNTVIDAIRRVVSVDERSQILPSKEFMVLKTLCQESGRVWNRTDLLDYVWGMNSQVETNVVEATITNIRRRLAELDSTLKIRNMRNAGYWIEE